MEHYRVRSTDPLTSFEAADSIQPTADKHYELILWCLGHFGPLGKDGIASKIGLIGYQIGKRLTELERMDLIMLTGNIVKSQSGSRKENGKSSPNRYR